MAITLAARISAELRERIVTGKLRPGERLPSEKELATKHGVSRTVIREAIGSLRTEGLVRSTRGSGTYVLTVPYSGCTCAEGPMSIPLTGLQTEHPSSATDYFSSPSGVQQETETSGSRQTEPMLASHIRPDPAALLEFRLALEPHAAALAAERRTTADLAALESALTAMESAGAHAADSLEADYRLHRALASASGNSYTLGSIVRLGPAMIGMPAQRITGDGAHAHTVDEEHRTIVEAVRKRDARTAAAAMAWHLTRSLRDLG